MAGLVFKPRQSRSRVLGEKIAVDESEITGNNCSSPTCNKLPARKEVFSKF
jgi:hypothetical protein